MKFSGDYKKLQSDCINLWKQFSSFDFRKEINNIKPTFSLFSKGTDKKNYYALGCFNYIWERSSNVYRPNNLLTSRPNTEQYYEYVFSNNVLRLVKHFSDGINKTTLLIVDSYVFSIHNNSELSVIWVIDDDYQIKIALCGIEIEYLERINPIKYKNISCHIFFCVEETLELKNNVFYTVETNKRILKRRDEIEFLNKNINPYPLPDKFITNHFNMLKEAGFDEE